jgi:uncharacterized protein YdaU (DUF1376 family)
MPEHFEYFPLYVHQLLSSRDVRKMKAPDFGGYMLLLIESFISDPQGYLPDDAEELRELARMTTEEWGKYGEKLTKKFKKRQGGLIYNSRMMEVIKELRMKREKAANAGRIGASKRWGQAELPFDDNSDAIASPSSEKSHRREEKRRRKRREEKGIQYTLDFDSFWNSYPHGTSRAVKSQTFRNWERLLKEGILPGDLLKAVDNYIENLKITRQEPDYYYKASNFVGRHRYFEAFIPGVYEKPKPKGPIGEEGMITQEFIDNESPEDRAERHRKIREHNEWILSKDP